MRLANLFKSKSRAPGSTLGFKTGHNLAVVVLLNGFEAPLTYREATALRYFLATTGEGSIFLGDLMFTLEDRGNVFIGRMGNRLGKYSATEVINAIVNTIVSQDGPPCYVVPVL